MSSTTFPDGTTLVSSALTPQTLLAIMQPLGAGMLGIIPADYSLVRIEWPTTGAPAWPITQDVAFLRAVEVADDYDQIRDQIAAPNDSTTVQLQITYTRVWEVHFCLYGPNCFDRIRTIKDALFLDWTHDVLAASNLYLVPPVSAPLYLPELFASQWWARVDMSCRFNEGVTDTLVINSVGSAEIEVYDYRGRVADVTVAVS